MTYIDPHCTCRSAPCAPSGFALGDTTYSATTDACSTPCTTLKGAKFTATYARCSTYGCPLWDGLWRDTTTGIIYLHIGGQVRGITNAATLVDCYPFCGVYDAAHSAILSCTQGPLITDKCLCPPHPVQGGGCGCPKRTGCTAGCVLTDGLWRDTQSGKVYLHTAGQLRWITSPAVLADCYPGCTLHPTTTAAVSQCVVGAVIDNNCTCPQGAGCAAPHKTGCGPPPPPTCNPACTGGATCVGTTCTCPAGTTWNGSACITPVPPPPPPSSGPSAALLLILAGAGVVGYELIHRRAP